ncbi:MAG: cyclomaltodextrin glucanotransferase [Synechococcaceae cyanobacterium SM2_3_1]|nr:cyclomaltodextrin glucanotransferase [Synechococcaceae cyanobacterium SM2_3_1]
MLLPLKILLVGLLTWSGCCSLLLAAPARAGVEVESSGVSYRNQGPESPQDPGKGNLDNDVLYYIIVDRFYDADPTNNVPTYAFPLDQDLSRQDYAYNELNQLLLQQSFDPTHRYIGLYWGGDLEGVIEKLDYLKDLGVTKIVLSPIQDNANGFVYYPDSYGLLQTEKPDDDSADNIYRHATTAFHGYWTKDWFEIDEHFRDPEDQPGDPYAIMRQLLNQAAARDIGIILDLTLNHTSPFPYYRYPPEFIESSIGFWFVDNGSVYRHGQRVATYWDPTHGKLDPSHWFHPFQPIDFNRPNPDMVERGTLPGGLPDLDQDNPEVESYLLDAVRFWLTFNADSHPIAGFRLDAVKHVNVSFWKKLQQVVLEINPKAVLIGEYFSGGYRNMDSIRWLEQAQNYTMFNFGLSMSARNFFARRREWDGRTYMLQEATLGRQGNYYNMDPFQQLVHRLLDPGETLDIPRKALDLTPDADMKAWVNFVENHDIPRLMTAFSGMSEAAYASLIKFMFVTPGVPMLMYGTETGLRIPYHPEHAGLFGVGGDPFNRQMMIWSDQPGWRSNLYAVTRSMAHLRQEQPVLRYGATRYLQPRNGNAKDDLFLLRTPETCADPCSHVLYAYSTFGGDFLLQVETIDPRITRYKNAETQLEAPALDGLLGIRLQPEEAKVYVLS